MRALAHIDLDAFFAAVEELERPSLRGHPLIVGGDPNSRGVVATANYAARAFGIRSAMSAAEAHRRCPTATFVRPRHTLYRQYSSAVWTTIRDVVGVVEQTGLDEGYLDLGDGTRSFADARALAEAVQTAVRAATSLSCSLGVSTSKVVCKVASDRRKPGGITIVPPGREAGFLAPLPTRTLPGIGPRAELRLRGVGVVTIGQLAALADDDIRALLPGSVGLMLRDRARGTDPRPLETEAERTSISVEETFARDIVDRNALRNEVDRLASLLGERMRAQRVSGRTVSVKLRYGDFSIRSRSTTLPAGTDDAERIAEVAQRLLDSGLRDRPGPLRLVGIGASGLSGHMQLALDSAADETALGLPGGA